MNCIFTPWWGFDLPGCMIRKIFDSPSPGRLLAVITISIWLSSWADTPKATRHWWPSKQWPAFKRALCGRDIRKKDPINTTLRWKPLHFGPSQEEPHFDKRKNSLFFIGKIREISPSCC